MLFSQLCMRLSHPSDGSFCAFALFRLLVPVAWTICYQLVVPANLLWSVLVPLCFITWQNGRLPSPADMEWWLIMFIGLYLKCWGQVCAILAFFLRWW
jgi:hypothetical protein